MTVAVQGLFETHRNVANLAPSLAFYEQTVGLILAQRFPERRATFFWVGDRGHAMPGLWEVETSPNPMQLDLLKRPPKDPMRAGAS